MNTKILKRWILLLSILLSVSFGQTRKELRLPEIKEYETLVCDFHMHTVFSDGNVWPSVRVGEAYKEGLDVIAITDHIEYKPFKKDIPVNYGRSYEIAKPIADEMGILLIKGAEITRSMPPGHINALFIKDIEPLNDKDPMKAIELAAKQGAYIFWNHPGWSRQLKDDGIVRWYDEHTEIFEKGWLKGIEIVNHKDYYPEVFQWALDKDLTFFGNSDVHNPVDYRWEPQKKEHRPYTIVFAKNKTIEDVRDALEQKRTLIYYDDKIIGREKLIAQFFNGCIINQNPEINPDEKGRAYIQIENISDLPIYLIPSEKEEFTLSNKITILPGTSERVKLKLPEKLKSSSRLELNFMVENFLVAPGKGLESKLNLSISK